MSFRLPALALSLLAAAPALAAPQSGCTAPDWDLAPQRALLSGAGAASSPLSPPGASRVALGPLSGLPKPPERRPREADARAGSVEVAVPADGTYRVTLTAEGWIDAVQAGAYVKSGAFRSVSDCAGIRKSVEFRLKAGPATIQVSGVTDDALALAVTAAP